LLGTYGTTSEILTQKDYLNFMYGGAQGFIARGTINGDNYRQQMYTSEWIINRNRYFGDVYVSLNTFCKRERTVKQLKRLNALYLDIDCYKLGLTQAQVIFALETDYFGKSLPQPTFVIDSGRGLYLIWKIDEDPNALPRWRRVQQYLYETCKHFNADAQALDAARIFRVPFSVNSKNNATVSIKRFTDVKYTLHEIIKEHKIQPFQKKSAKQKHPYGTATEKQRQTAALIADKHALPLPNFDSYKETFDFISAHYSPPKPLHNNAWCSDIKKLFSLRFGDDCRRREVGLFLYRLWLCESTQNYEYALNETLRLNSTFDRPLPEKYVISKTFSAEKKVRAGETYKYGKQKLVQILDITLEEMQHLRCLCICPATLKERIRAKNRRNYLSRLALEGKPTKQDALLHRRTEIKSMLSRSTPRHTICKILNISPKTLSRDILFIQNDLGGSAPEPPSAFEKAEPKLYKITPTPRPRPWTFIQPLHYERTCFASSEYAFSLIPFSFLFDTS